MAGVLNDLLDEDALIVADAAHAALPGYQSGQVIRHYNQVWTSSWQVMGSAIQWTLWGSGASSLRETRWIKANLRRRFPSCAR